MAAQHKATLRISLRSALKHRRLANEILDSLKDSQEKWNSAMDKLDADTAAALDTDYEATQAITDLFEADDEKAGAQHKATLRKTLRSALSHKRLADEIADAMEEMQTSHNALMVKLDAEAGTLNDVDYESSLGLIAIDANAKGIEAQHEASLRKSLKSALSHRKLADVIMDNIIGLQGAINASLVLLDAGTVNGAHAAQKVTVIDPDAI